MISDWLTNRIYLSGKLTIDFPKTSKDIGIKLKSFGYEPEFLLNTNDIWARDYMPIQISENKFIEYRFDPDYLQGKRKGYRNSKTYPDIVCDSIGLKTEKSNIILDGGNVVKSSNCIILTDKVVKENQFHYSEKELLNTLHDTFQVEKIVLIPWDKSEEYGHSDGMVRFIDSETVVTQYYFKDYPAMIKPLKQAGLKIEFIDYKAKKNDKLDWAYLNFLQTKDLILLPKFGIEQDEEAFEKIENFYTDYKGKIVQIDMNETVIYGGTLNCIAWTTKE